MDENNVERYFEKFIICEKFHAFIFIEVWRMD